MSDTRTPVQAEIEPEYFLKLYREIAGQRRATDDAKDGYKAKLHAAGAAGVHVKALKLVDKVRRMDPREGQSYVRYFILYMGWLGVSILDQEEIFANGPMTAGLTSKVIEEHAAWEAGRDGYEAGKAGKPLDANPFTPGAETHQRWATEWYDGNADRIAKNPDGIEDIQPKDHERRPPEEDDEGDDA